MRGFIDWLKQNILIGILIGIPLLAFLGVQAYQKLDDSLPIINPDPDSKETHKIPEFSFTNQYGEPINLDTFQDKVFIANFFFTSCPTTCPPMMEQLTRVQEEFSENPDLRILSHTVDPRNDTVEALRAYGKEYEVQKGFWHLVTGSKKALYSMARNGYDVVSVEGDKDGPAGFVHSSKLILIDRKNRIRGYYDGTRASDVDRLMNDLKFLLKEASQRS